MTKRTSEYRVLADGWLNGRRVAKDEIVTLTAAGAKYANVAPAVPQTAEADEPARVTGRKAKARD
jgi:hypothetical protein